MPRNSVSRSEVLEILQELIRTPSVNPSIALDEGCGEEAIAKVARQCLEARGVKSWLEESAPGRPDVVAEVGAGNAGTVVFCAHLDTVGTAGHSGSHCARHRSEGLALRRSSPCCWCRSCTRSFSST